MKDTKPKLEPKQSTINKILAFSQSIEGVKSKVLDCKVITNLN